MNEIETWIVGYFREHGNLDREADDGMLEVNYFEREYLDSLGVVQLITGLEDDFEIRVEAEHMQDPRFCTIRGLAQIVEELRPA